MNGPEDFELLRRLRDLPRESEPPPEVEDRVVAALRECGLLAPAGRGARHGRSRGWWRLAAAALIGLLGGWLGHALVAVRPAPPAAPGSPYLLLLSEPTPLATGKSTPELVAEYRAWAIGLAEEGRLVDAARLAESGRRLRPGTDRSPVSVAEPSPADATGFFIVKADSLDHAARLAATCPHLGYGGEISVRPIAVEGADHGG